MKINLTPEEFKKCLPTQFQGNLNPEAINSINRALADPDTAETIKDNLVSYTEILKGGKFKLTSYIEAVRYVSYKMMGHSNLKAYVLTFPDKYNDMVNRGVTKKDISSYVSAYNKNKLVNLIYEQTLIPVHILNASNYQEAINVQMEIMRDTNISPKVRSDAANSILNHIKRPEESKIKLDVTHTESEGLKELRTLTRQLAEQQAKEINSGRSSAKNVAETQIINGEYEEVDNG